jgi:hypothetical protein
LSEANRRLRGDLFIPGTRRGSDVISSDLRHCKSPTCTRRLECVISGDLVSRSGGQAHGVDNLGCCIFVIQLSTYSISNTEHGSLPLHDRLDARRLNAGFEVHPHGESKRQRQQRIPDLGTYTPIKPHSKKSERKTHPNEERSTMSPAKPSRVPRLRDVQKAEDHPRP